MKQEKLIIRYIICLVLGIIFLYPGKAYSLPAAFEGDLWSTSPPVSVGSGARAQGMGSAFIAVADDATAASWNPGGLGQLQKPEVSVVGSNFYKRVSGNDFITNTGTCSISSLDLNYLSIAYARNIWQRNVFFSLNYQKLFDFSREQDFKKDYLFEYEGIGHTEKKDLTQKSYLHQEGSLYTLSPAMAIEFKPGLYFGFTYNIWSDHITGKSQWICEQKEILTDNSSNTIWSSYETNLAYKDFRAENWTLGLLWKITPQFRLGGVYKMPFRARVKCEYTILRRPRPYQDPNGNLYDPIGEENYQIDFPAAYGMGFSFRIGDSWTLAGDITRTEWQDYIITNSNGEGVGPFVGADGRVPHKDPTNTIRLGVEYAKIMNKIICPLRCGAFYDPEPSIGAPQDFYGVSFGFGIVTNRLAIDFSYQYRFGDVISEVPTGDVNTGLKIIKGKIQQHSLLSSLIFYF